ncbi:MAG: hypothetical protein AAF542_14705 [Pseudomonadota bacterium]
MRKMNRKRLAGASVLMASMAAPSALAQKWETSAELFLRAQQSDNPRLELTGAEDTLASIQTVRLGLDRDTRTLTLDLDLEAEFVQFSQSDILDDEQNQRGSLDIRYQSSPRTTYKLYTRYGHDSYSLRQAFEPDVIDPDLPAPDPVLADSLSQTRIDRWIALPSVEIAVGKRSQLELAAEHRAASFEEGNPFFLIDYESTQYTGQWKYALSSEGYDAIAVRLGYTDYTSDDAVDNRGDQPRFVAGLDATGIPLVITYRQAISENLYIEAKAGAVHLEFDEDGRDNETESLLGLRLATQDNTKRTTYSVTYAEHIQPSSGSSLVKTRDFSIVYDYKWTRKSRLGFTASAYQNEQIGLAQAVETDYYFVGPYYDWEATRNLKFRFDYQFRRIERDGVSLIANNSADENAFAIGVTYKFW